MKTYLIILLLFISIPSFAEDEIKLNSLNWHEHLASVSSAPDDIYSLMSNGFFLAPTSKNINILIKTWLKEHPKSKIVKIVERSPVMTNKPNSKFIYFWVVSKNDNLNLYLIEKGALPADTMLIAKDDTLLIHKDDFDIFYKKSIQASKKASSAKIGIYTEK